LEGVVPLDPPFAVEGACRGRFLVALPVRADRRLKLCKAVLEHKLRVEGGHLDRAQAWLTLDVPAARPANWMTDRAIAWVAADEAGGERAGALELGERRLVAGGLGKPPVHMQPVFRLPAFWVEPDAARAGDNGRPAEDLFESRARETWVGVAFDRQRQPLGDIDFGGAAGIGEDGDRRREDDLLIGVGGATSAVEGAVANMAEIAVELDRIDQEGLERAAVLVKGPQRNKIPRRRVAEQAGKESFQWLRSGSSTSAASSLERNVVVDFLIADLPLGPLDLFLRHEALDDRGFGGCAVAASPAITNADGCAFAAGGLPADDLEIGL
jgi:hypothetical protein